MKCIIALALAWVGLAYAQPPDTYTHNMMNCRLWNGRPNVPRSERITFRYGVLGAFAEMWSAIKDSFERRGINFIPTMPSINQPEAIDGITAICARPEDAKITIFQAMVLFVQKVSGKSEAEIEEQSATFRRLANEP